MTRMMLLAAAGAVAILPAMAAAQAMGGMPMPGMKMPAKPTAKARPKPTAKAKRKSSTRKRPAHRAAPGRPPAPMPMGAMPGMDMTPSPAPAPAAPAAAMPGMAMGTPTPAAPAPAVPGMPGMPGMAMPPAPADPANAMPGMTMPQSSTAPMAGMPGMRGMTGASAYADGSGTSRLPGADGGMHGLHVMAGDWMAMIHGYVWGAYTAQSGPRGRDMAFATSMAMIEAERPLGSSGAKLTLRSMLSLDPLMGKRGYPSLFATGETADGVNPLIDRQHPHDLFMELSARVDVPVGGGWTGFVYGGPVAEPALGPSAFMHRETAKYLPLAPITHHWFDSTHISYGVVTLGVGNARWQVEGSAFRGREPDQHRWDIETPRLDSWSLRATWTPSPNWSAQVSYGRIKSPEALEPAIDEARTTASVQYRRGGFSALATVAIKNRVPGPALTAWLGEANWDLGKHHSLFGRLENVANDELFPNPADPLNGRKFRVTRGELGYAYRLPLTDRLGVAIGGSGFVVATPRALDAAYGKTPAGFTGFVKLSLGG